MKKSFLLIAAIVMFILGANSFAQLTGTKNIPGDYGTLALAITDLNTQGVGAGGVTINLIAGNPQTAPAGGYSITTITGTSGNQITIQGNGNTITAPTTHTVGALNDAIFKLIGADYVTITGFVMTENAANIITAAATNNMTEWGVALLYATTTNGAQNNTISGNTIDLNRTYQNTFGIYSNSTHTATAVTTSATATTTAGANSQLVITGNTITDVNTGIVVIGPTAAADHNVGLIIGGSLGTANSITNFGTTSTFSGYANVSGTMNGILIRNTKAYTVMFNTITSSSNGTGFANLRGVHVIAFSNAPTGTFTNNISNNTISLQSGLATTAITGIEVAVTTSTSTATTNIIFNNFNTFGHTVAGTGAITMISNSMATLNQNINSNTFTNISCNTTGSFTFLSNAITLPSGGTMNVNSNSIVTGFSKTGAGGTVTIFSTNASSTTGTTINNNSNNFSNITVTGGTTLVGWINTDGGTPVKTIQGNTFSNWTGGTSAITVMSISFSSAGNYYSNTISNITGAGTITGFATGSGTDNIYSNSISGLSSTGASTVTGMWVTSGTAKNLFKNKVYDLTANNAGGVVNGITVSSGTTVNVYNNLVGDLKTPASNLANAINGINITSTTSSSAINVYYNSIFINAASTGTIFGSSGIFHTSSATATTAALNMRNNIIVNTSTTGSSSGVTVAYRRSSNVLTNYVSTSNNNLFYAGTPSGTNLIFSDNTNQLQTLALYKALTGLSPRDGASVTENPNFLSTAGSNANFLHINTSIATQIESGASNIASYTNDYDGNIRQGNGGYVGTGTAPDIGADEFEGTGVDLSAPVISYTSLGSTCSTSDITLSGVTITDATGVPTTGTLMPRIYYRKNGGSYFSQPGTLVTGTATSGTWSFPIVVADLGGVTGGDVIGYFVIAQDIVGTPNISSNPSGVVATDVNTITTPPTPNTYSIGLTLSGDYLVGAGQTFTTLTAAVNAYNNACGLSGAVRFLLNDATYASETFPITINHSSYSSATNTLTILPNSGVTSTISGSNSSAVIKLNGADYVTIDGSNNGTSSRNLTLNNTNTTGSVVWVGSSVAGSGATNNTVKNTVITGNTGTSTIAGIIVGSGVTLGSAAESPNNNLTIQNNLITKAQNGIYNSGNVATPDLNCTIDLNTIGSVTVAEKLGYRGLIVLSMQNVTISNNTVMGVTTSTTSTTTGIAVGNNIVGGNIFGNKVSDIKNTNGGGYGCNGIQLGASSTTSALNVYNNFIWDIAGYGYVSSAGIADNGYGIIVYSGGGYNIYYNSISLATNQTVNGLPAAINIGSGITTAASVNLRDNIFSNTQTTGTNRYAIYCAAASSVFASIDYNDYYAGTAPNLGFIGSNRATLTDIQTGFGSNTNSKAVDPLFTSTTDLHLQAGSTLDASATPIAGITTDIDGAVRNALTPDMGADEFTGSDLTGPTITYTALTNTTSVSNRAFGSVTITDVSGVQVIPTGQPKCYYKRSTDADAFNDNTPGTDGWKYVDCNGSSSPFDFTIDYSLLNGGGGVSTGNVVQYFVTAEDMAGTPNVSINSGSFAASQTSCLLDPSAFPIGGTVNSYQITGAPMAGDYTVGLTMLRQHTGKNIEERLMTRKVKKLVPEESLKTQEVEKSEGKDNTADNTSTSIYGREISGRMVEIEVEETYTELYLDGKKYNGSTYTEYSSSTNKVSGNSGKGNSTGNTELIGNYGSIPDAIADLNLRGVSGAVTFLLIDNAYTLASTVTINNNIAGISSSNNVTIRPQTGVTPVAISGTILSNALLSIKSSYVTIDGSNNGSTSRDLQFSNTAVTAPICLAIGSTGTTTLTDATVKNCILTSGGSTISGAVPLIISDGTILGNAGYLANITVQNNLMEKGLFGVYTRATAGFGSSISFLSNTMTSTGTSAVGYIGIYTEGFDGITVRGNEIANFDGTASQDDKGMWLASSSKNATVEKNNIHDLHYTGTGGYGGHGIMITSATSSCNVTAKNNIIYGLSGDGYSYSGTLATDNPIGIAVGAGGTTTQSGINIYNNTIMLSGNTLNRSGALSMGIRIGTGSTVVDIRNNLVINNLGLLSATGDGACGLFVKTASTQLSACDNNCYYINPTAGAKNFGRIVTTGQTTLAGWRTATGKETISFSSNPVFISGTDFHITATDLSVSGRGTYIASVTDDYDGNSRPTSQSSSLRPVDVGADQYTPAGYSGNVLTPAVSGVGIYYDGDLRAVEIVSLTTGTIGGIKQYPGVKTPNNVLRPNKRNNNTQEKINSKPLNKDGKLNNKKKDGTSGGNMSGEAVNTPWIYWELTGMSVGTVAALRFYYNEDQLAGMTESTLRLSYWDPNANAWENSFTQSVNTTNNYIEVSFPTGMNWTGSSIFAIEDPATPLPVELESFDISINKRDAGLNWVTTFEVNNKGFGIERKVKTEGGYTAWKEIGFVNGNGTSNKGFAYSYTDKKLNKGAYQYRLRQVDYNGNAEYFSPSNTSDIVVGNPNVFDLGQNYPNPSNPKSKIDFQMPFDGKVSIKVYDLLGREVATLIDGIKTADFYTVEFDGSNLASGTYFYRIIAESGTEKFTKTLKIVLVK